MVDVEVAGFAEFEGMPQHVRDCHILVVVACHIDPDPSFPHPETVVALSMPPQRSRKSVGESGYLLEGGWRPHLQTPAPPLLPAASGLEAASPIVVPGAPACDVDEWDVFC